MMFVYAATGAMLGIVVLAVVIWSIRRHHDPKLAIESDAPIDKQMQFFASSKEMPAPSDTARRGERSSEM